MESSRVFLSLACHREAFVCFLSSEKVGAAKVTEVTPDGDEDVSKSRGAVRRSIFHWVKQKSFPRSRAMRDLFVFYSFAVNVRRKRRKHRF